MVGGEPRVDVEEYEELSVVEVCEGTFVGVAAGIVKGCVFVVWGCGGGDGGSGWFVRVLLKLQDLAIVCMKIPRGMKMLRYLSKASLFGLVSPIEKEKVSYPKPQGPECAKRLVISIHLSYSQLSLKNRLFPSH